uniref:Golgin subfamily A conserved domain-containing protein n=1 Tax=Heliothis virescens TaxID=7102 RepID=A0A2A4JBZ0_HELVI
MEDRAAKLALARKKLKDHQEKKLVSEQKDDTISRRGDIVSNENSELKYEEGFITQSTQDTVNSQSSDTTDKNKTDHLVSLNINPNKNTNSADYNSEDNVNVTEFFISTKRNLELQVHQLQSKLDQLEQKHALMIDDYKICNQKLNELEIENKNLNEKYLNAMQNIMIQDAKLNELNSVKQTLSEENSNLSEQIEFTKTVLNAKEAESDSLHNQLYNLQNQYDVIVLQLQQLTNGSTANAPSGKSTNSEKVDALVQKNSSLEQQLGLLQKERDQINQHYEQYVSELNEQLRCVIKKNEELTREVENLSNRENSLIEQISDMEIRIQNYNMNKKTFEIDRNTSTINDLQDNLKKAQDDLNELRSKHETLQTQYAESVAKIQQLSEVKAAECHHDNISISKLSADMASDKVAAQRATEQNKKLKQDLQDLEDAFVKMSKDKLELTEKVTAEKYLNRELTIKLSEVEEMAKDMQIKLKAKDEEMIRLQANYRTIKTQCENLTNLESNNTSTVSDVVPNSEIKNDEEEFVKTSETECKPLTDELKEDKRNILQRSDAMTKLQERFLKIMGEVADLSDEKHRLEHIILQLQNETDTICEYVALYQQQRSLLKRRDEERSAQLKIFQEECGKLKNQLEELSGLLSRFAQDKELSFYFETESKRIDMEHVMTLLDSLKNNSLIDINKKNIEFKNFYPCNCCSGKLIDV